MIIKLELHCYKCKCLICSLFYY